MLSLSAQRAVEARDFSSAWYWLQRLYRQKPDDLATNRLIAQFEEAEQSPEELTWRVRVIQIGPATMDDYTAWAAAALRLGQSGVALEALAHVPAQWRQNAGYHELLAGAYLADGQPDAADEHFATAARMEPGNPIHLINLATVRLQSADEAIRQEARAVLEKQAASTQQPLPAIRALLTDALRQRDAGRIAKYRAMMRGRTDRTLGDELSSIAGAPDIATARAELSPLWDGVKKDPAHALQVAEWMMRHGDATEALAWLRALPAEMQTAIGIQMGEADAMTAARDWAGLRVFLTGKNWRTADCLRTALLVRCARETGAPAPAWADAIAACHGDGAGMLLLARTADGWTWKNDAEALYWRISQLGFPSRGPALKALWNRYTEAENTDGLLRVAREQYKDEPADLAIRNNYAFLSLLMGYRTDEVSRIAREDIAQQPDSAILAATYAYSLYLAGHYADGLQALSHFDNRRMRAAGASLYLALLQAAAGDATAASRTAAEVNAEKLLPEERALLQKLTPKTSAAAPVEHFQINA
jgi:predicted Zn-dependent protease